jgi:hypothetical protein
MRTLPSNFTLYGIRKLWYCLGIEVIEMAIGDMLKQEAEFHYRYIRKQVERLEEMKREGRRYIDMPIDEVIKMLMDAHALHVHLDRVEDHLGAMAENTFQKFLVPSGAISPGTDILSQLEAKQKAYEYACSAGDVKEMERLAPKGPTYGDVVRPHSPAEEQRRIDAVNKARGH